MQMPHMPGARSYHHYAYMMEPQPPFRICAVSKELPLQRFNSTIHAGAAAAAAMNWKRRRLHNICAKA
jgi:hypothetical protein